MRVAIYHNLQASGARRALNEIVAHTATEIEYDVYQFDRPSLRDALGKTYSHSDYVYEFSERQASNPLTQLRYLTKVQKKIAQDINAGGYDAIYVNHCQYTHTPLILNWLTLPSVYYAQDPRRLNYEASAYRDAYAGVAPFKRVAWAKRQKHIKHLEQAAALKATRILANSRYSIESLARAWGRYAEYVPLGVDTNTFKPTQSKTSKKKVTPYVIAVGTIHASKAQDFIITALGQMPDADRPDLALVYERADTQYLAKLQTKAKQTGVKLQLHQGITDQQLANLYAGAIATVCVAELEPLGLTPLESQACGTPSIAVAEGGYRETVGSHNGLLISRSEDELASAIVAVQKKSWDAKAMRQAVEKNWNWDATGRHFLKIMRDVTHSR